MILNTGQRTDIPAFYSDWLCRRIRQGFVMVRNPYYPQQVTRYRIHPDVVDLIAFCTKNPKPMLSRMEELRKYETFWFVTITPYGKEVEPNVPDPDKVIQSFQELSQIVGPSHIAFRYDPIFINEKYSVEAHIRYFEQFCCKLSGYVHEVVISFIDLYEKTRRNFPQVREVTMEERKAIGEAFGEIARSYHMVPYTCLEGTDMEPYGFRCTGCMSLEVIERALGEELRVPSSRTQVRSGCSCLIGNDIGAYNSCGHGCLYCYANQNRDIVKQIMRQHDPKSPFLIGHSQPDDQVHEADQKSWRTGQILLSL